MKKDIQIIELPHVFPIEFVEGTKLKFPLFAKFIKIERRVYKPTYRLKARYRMYASEDKKTWVKIFETAQ